MPVPTVTKPAKQISEADAAITPLQLAASNGPIIEWKVTPLPKGLSYSKITGIIKGTPTEKETVTVKLHAKNGTGESLEVTFEWEITSQAIFLSNGKEVKFVEPTKANVIKQIELGRKGLVLSFITVYQKENEGEPFIFSPNHVVSVE